METPVKKRMVAGFMFSPDRKRVVLIEKTKPEWQRGLLNGVGGKIEGGELPYQAQVREFREEGGYTIEDPKNDWKCFYVLTGDFGEVHFFKGFGDVDKVQTMEDEKIVIINVTELWSYKTVYNLKWLIPLALDDSMAIPLYGSDLVGVNRPLTGPKK
jgi:8-oxo-dGTP diphosphatase